MAELLEIEESARNEIASRLNRIAAEENIRILLAVESGSRAWGFPSPDSDYDARFLYVRPTRDYLRLNPIRDVVERPIVDLFDVNGWDIKKALALLLKHNAVVAEWINSPIRYQQDDPSIEMLSTLADRHFNPRGYALHYASLGMNNARRWIGGSDAPSVKRYFYALRPALCIRALRLKPASRPPMNLQELLKVTDLPGQTVAQIEHLVRLKSSAKEAAPSTRFRDIEKLIAEEFDRADQVPERTSGPDFEQEANTLFFDLLTA